MIDPRDLSQPVSFLTGGVEALVESLATMMEETTR